MNREAHIVIDGKFLDKDSQYEKMLETAPEWQKPIWDFLLHWFDERSFIEAQTSGSTGAPKRILLQKETLWESARNTCAYFQLNHKSKGHLCIPAKYIGGKMMLVRALYSGMRLSSSPPSSSPQLPEDPIDFLALTPMQFSGIYETHPDRLRQCRKIIIGGGRLSQQQEEVMVANMLPCYSTYGMTETASHVALRKVGTAFFKAIGSTDFSVDDRNCLMIHAEALGIGTLVTNDLVELKGKKEFKWLGRFDNVVNSGGVKLYPEKLEANLSKHISQPFFFAGVADDVLGQRLVLLVEGSQQPIDFSLLSKLERPKKVYFIDHFFFTETGKIDRPKTLALIQ